jgi:hypothetical protein
MDWIDQTQDRGKWRVLVNTVMNFRVPLIVRKFLSSCKIGSFSGRAQFHKSSLSIILDG